jgi:hypothetical protein
VKCFPNGKNIRGKKNETGVPLNGIKIGQKSREPAAQAKGERRIAGAIRLALGLRRGLAEPILMPFVLHYFILAADIFSFLSSSPSLPEFTRTGDACC